MTQISNTNKHINFLQTLTFNILNQTVIMYRQTPNRNQESSLRPPKMPDRPLVPYMRFSKKMWPKVRADNPDSPLWDLGKIIGQMWNSAPPTEKQIYQHEYETDKSEYEKAMKNYNATYAQYMAAKSRVKGPQEGKPTGGGGGRKGVTDQQNSVTGVFIQPVDEEDPFEMAGKRLAAIRYDRNNRLMAELFSPNYMPDPRSFVTQQRIEHFRRQAQSLEQHQTKQNDELAKLEEMFNQRKRAVEKASEEYAENMKRICQEKPTQLDQAHYEKVAEEYGEQLLANWKVFEEKQAAIQAKLEADRRANPVLSDLITSKTPPANESESAMAPTERMEGEAIAVDEEKQTIVAAAVVDGEGDDGTAATSSSQNEQPNRREEETVVVNGEMDAIEAGEADEV